MPDSPSLSPCMFIVGETYNQSFHYDEASIRAYAASAGDYNPMHHDAAFAKSTRFGGLIASAAHYSSQMMGSAATFLSERSGSLGLEFSFGFKHAVRVGSEMTLTWRVAEIEPKISLHGHIVTLHGVLTDVDGVIAVTAMCKAAVIPQAAMGIC